MGRLDVETEGLLLLTNDGELTNRLTHPSYEVPKTYLVQVRGPMQKGVGAAMKAGIELEDGIASVDSFRLVDSTPGHLLIEVVLHSGRNRIVRRLFDAVGHPVRSSCAPRSAPSGSGTSARAPSAACRRPRSGTSSPRWALRPSAAPTAPPPRAPPGPCSWSAPACSAPASAWACATSAWTSGCWTPRPPPRPWPRTSAPAAPARGGAGRVPQPALVVVATPPDVTAETVVEALGDYPEAVVLDIASVKAGHPGGRCAPAAGT